MPVFEVSVFALLSVLSSTIGLLGVAVLMFVRHERTANPRWLYVFLGLTTLSGATQFFAEISLFAELPVFLIVFAGLPFLAAPSLLRYTDHVIGHEPTRQWVLGAVLIAGLALATAWWRSFELENTFLTVEGKVLGAAFYASSLTFSIAALGRIRSLRARLKENFVDLAPWKLTWLQAIVVAYISVLLLDFVLGYLLSHLAISWQYAGAILASVLMIFIALTTLFALRQAVVFSAGNTLPCESSSPDPIKKYASSGLDGVRLNGLVERLELAMRRDCWYLENGLSLDGLARKLNTKRHHLSQALNQHLGQSFYEYINAFRIDHAKFLLRESMTSVLEIAYACGYNNKASFYNAFKEITGETPLQYRRSQNNNGRRSIGADKER